MQNRFREVAVASLVVTVTLILYVMLTSVESALHFFVSSGFLFLASSFVVLPFIEYILEGTEGVRVHWQSTVVIMFIGLGFMVIYMAVTRTTFRMMLERVLEYILYALLISFFAGRVKKQIMKGIR